jgi:outer membrane receptor for ferrienterochelin and colicin
MDGNFSFSDTVTQKNIKTVETGLYIEDDWTISNNLKVNFGLHYASFLLQDKSYHSLQPRVSSRWLLPKDWSIKGSFATMQQYINLLAFEGIGLPTDLWVPTTDRIKPQDSWQVALGVAKSLGSEYEFSTEIYYKKMKNLVAYKDGQGVFQSDDWQNRVTQGDGEAYGLEVFLQKKEGRLSGWIGYTLAYAYRQFDEIDEGRKFPYRFDRRHDISIVANYNITKKINFAATWVYGTGNAVTLAGTKVESHNQNASNPFSNFNNYDVFGQRNNFRLRPYHRMDIGFNFTKQKKHYERIWSFGAYNTYANNNPFFVYFDTETINNERVTKLKQVALFPLVPYITYTANF